MSFIDLEFHIDFAAGASQPKRCLRLASFDHLALSAGLRYRAENEIF